MTTRHGGLPAVAPSPLILIVEDDVETRQFYLRVLTLDGFRTDQAHNGFQAFEKALQDRPNLILTDIAVPGIDGIELCRRLRADERTSQIPVLAITGYGDRQYEDRARHAGAGQVLIKPCGAELLIAEARRLLADAVDVAKLSASEDAAPVPTPPLGKVR
jgi:CheY-like chemotaxis protein